MGGKANRASRSYRWLITRRIVQGLMVLLFALPLIAVGWSLFGLTPAGDIRVATPAELPFYGSLSSSQIGEFNLLDPYAVLQLTAATKDFELEWLLFALPLLLAYVLIRARGFCGWICPGNLFFEGVDFLRKKLGITTLERVVPRRAKIGIAAGILVLSYALSVPLFEVFSPISTLNKGIILGSTAGLLVLVALVVLELFWSRRVWCRALCPLGGFYQSLGRVGLVKVRINYEACIHCNACKEACLASPEILDPTLAGDEKQVRAGDCMLCGECIDVCPTHALSVSLDIE